MWEYKMTQSYSNVERLGQEGWELVTVATPADTAWVYFMKRRIHVDMPDTVTTMSGEIITLKDEVFGEYKFGDEDD